MWINLKIKCTIPRNCDYGIVKDIQEYCDVCALGPGEYCGGFGTCGMDWSVSKYLKSAYGSVSLLLYQVSWSRLCNLNNVTIDAPKDRSWKIIL